MRARYFLVIQNSRIQVFPKGTEKLKYVTQREKDQIFYRRKLNGTLVFVGSDFAHLLQVEESEDRCIELKLEIEKDCAGVWEPDWKGYFSCNDVKWDKSKCVATVTPKPDDEYRIILDNYSKDFNVLKTPGTISVDAKLDFIADFEFTTTAADAQPEEDSDTWALFMNLNYFIKGNLVTGGERNNVYIHFRLIRFADMVDGEPVDLSRGGWIVVNEDIPNNRAKYAKRPDLYNFKTYDWSKRGEWNGKYPELIEVPAGTSYDTNKYIDVTASFSDNWCGLGTIDMRYDIFDSRCVKILWEFGRFSFQRNRTLSNVIRYLVEQTATADLLPADNLVLSKFFHASVNYVTDKPNTLNGMQVAALSDIIGYNSSEAATKAEWSLKKLFDSLRQMFRVYWDIQDGKLRIEHESFFQLQGTRDLTTYQQQLKGTDAYEYVKQDMPRFQKLTFTNAFNDDFEKGVIEYSGVCVTVEEGQDTEEENVSEVSTDLEHLLILGGTTGQKGFVFLLVQNGQVLVETGDLSGKQYPNVGLSAANLTANYYTYNRVLEHGVVNGKIRQFKSVNKVKKQVPLTVPICCEKVNPYARFISTLGDNAELESMSYNLTTGSVEFTLLHETSGKGPLSLGRQFDDSFDNSFS